MGSTTSSVPIPNPYPGWSDSPVLASVTKVRKTHVDELRDFLEKMSDHVHLFSETTSQGPSPTTGVNWGEEIKADETRVRDNHWLEVRSSLEDLDGHYHVVPGYSNSSSTKDIDTAWDATAGKEMQAGNKILVQHINEVRSACGELYNHTHTLTWCDCVGYCASDCDCQHQKTCVIHRW